MISANNKKSGFTLVEVMLAAGILAIGFMLILTLWPAGIKMTATATERVIGKVVADEAFAKIRLYGLSQDINVLTNNTTVMYSEEILSDVTYLAMYREFDSAVINVGDIADWPTLYSKAQGIIWDERMYPSAEGENIDKKYCWSAIVRRIAPKRFQVTVFVSRLVDGGAEYPLYDVVTDTWSSQRLPEPVAIGRDISDADSDGEIIIDNSGFNDGLNIDYLAKYVNDGSIIVDDKFGWMMRVLERKVDETPDPDVYKLVLADVIDEARLGNKFWVVPSRYKANDTPPKVGGRCPCINVFQRVIDF